MVCGMTDRQGAKAPSSPFESTPELDDLAYRVIGAAIEVHRHLGPGFSEAVYEEALAIEFQLRGIPFSRQCVLAVRYKDREVGEGRADFVVGQTLVVEIKAVQALSDVHTAQVISYLKAGDFHLGLLLNFREASMQRGVKRVVWSQTGLRGEHSAGYVKERQVAYGGLVVSCRDAPKPFEVVEEDLDAIA